MEYKCEACQQGIPRISISNIKNSEEYMNTLISKPQDINHSICVECINKMIGRVDNQINEKEKSILHYRTTLAEIEMQLIDPQTSGNCISDQEEQLSVLLYELQKEENAITGQLIELEKQEKAISSDEEKYWIQLEEFEKKLIANKKHEAALLKKLDSYTNDYSKCCSFKILNDIFKIEIDSDNNLGVINNYELCNRKVECNQIDWEKVNYAVGQIAMVQCLFSSKLAITLDYPIFPLGSVSKISSGKDNMKYDLFWPTNESKYNEALSNLTQNFKAICVKMSKQLKVHGVSWFPPYE